MGCSASKEAVTQQVHPEASKAKETAQVVPVATQATAAAPATTPTPAPAEHTAEKAKANATGSQPQPSAAPASPAGSPEKTAAKKGGIAFEISLDDANNNESNGSNASKNSGRADLPKIDNSAMKQKLENADALWQQMDSKDKEGKRKPRVAQRVEDADEMRRRLTQKEERASRNRADELARIQAKLARAEERLKRVQERKRALETDGSEETGKIEYGGENDECQSSRRESNASVPASEHSVGNGGFSENASLKQEPLHDSKVAVQV